MFSSVSGAAIRVVAAVQRWASESCRLVDALVAAAVALISVGDLLNADVMPGQYYNDPVATVLVLAGAIGLGWRRTWPVAVPAVVVVVVIQFWIVGHDSYLAILALTAVYSVVVHGPDQRQAWRLGIGMSLALVLVASLTVLHDQDGFSSFSLASMNAYLAGAVAAGVVVRNRADRAEAERAREAAQAVATERARIAREMHDVVAHSMSVIAVQSAAAQEIARHQPDKAVEVLARIEAVSRDSLNEMRRMLGVLRDRDEVADSITPQPTLDDLGTLINHCLEAGIQAELVMSGHQAELPAGLHLAAFRIVQEALTNVLKHVGPPASVTVGLHFGRDSLVILVVDDGAGREPAGDQSARGGKGLIGMRERVGIYGGAFSVGPRPGGGFRLRAVLPLPDRARRSRPPAGSEPAAVGQP